MKSTTLAKSIVIIDVFNKPDGFLHLLSLYLCYFVINL